MLATEMAPLLKQYEDVKAKSLQVWWWSLQSLVATVFESSDSITHNYMTIGNNKDLFYQICSEQRLSVEGMEKDARLSDPNSSYYRKPSDYAMKVDSYSLMRSVLIFSF